MLFVHAISLAEIAAGVVFGTVGPKQASQFSRRWVVPVVRSKKPAKIVPAQEIRIEIPSLRKSNWPSNLTSSIQAPILIREVCNESSSF
jgi:hypothetical protein